MKARPGQSRPRVLDVQPVRTDTARDTYLNDVFGPAEAELNAVRRDPISLAPYEARLLQFLIRLGHVRTVVELGTLYGYSALAMAWALPADGRVLTIERDAVRAAEARRTFAASKVGNRIHLEEGDAEEILKRTRGPFDLVFIDANKAAYARYLDWAEANVRPGGFIVGDNTFLWGAVYDEASREVGRAQAEAMRQFNARLADPARYVSTLIPTAEGLTVAQKKF